MQLLGLLAAFVVILILVGRRLNIGLCILVGTGILALASLMPPRDLAVSIFQGLIQRDSVELVLDIVVITALAGVLKRFGLLDTMLVSVTRLLGGARLAIMAVPSIIGALPVLGGAILSAPMVDLLGDRLALTATRKASVNLVFRHAWFYIAPFSPALILSSRLTGVPLGQFILRLTPFAIVMLLAGYVFLLRRAREVQAPALAAEPVAGSGAVVFLRSSSPLAVGIVLSIGVGGVALPLYVAIGVGLALALFLSRGHEDFRRDWLRVTWTSIQWPIALTVASVMVFSRVLEDSGTAQALVDYLVGSGLPIWILAVALPLTIGFLTGTSMASVGIGFPVLVPLLSAHQLPMAIVVIYTAGALAYFVSPLHLCQVLSVQYFKETVPRLYREYWPVVACLAALTALYVVLSFG